MTETLLTYCGNVHPAADLAGWLAAVREHAVPVAAAARAVGRTFGLGAWWPEPVARRLANDGEARARVRAELQALDLPIWTLNVFPYAGFHDTVVKTAVYRPDWTTEERLLYTRQCAEAVAAMVPAGSLVPLSTLPLGYRGRPALPDELRVMARNLARAASALAAIEQATGVCCLLALEPEPDCLLETCAQAAAFLEIWLFEAGASTTVPAAVLRRHLGVCVDLCHLAVVGEDPVAALADLCARGIAVPKIQVSSCLELRRPEALDRLLAFAEPRYLHQTGGERGLRALDLDDVATRRAEFAHAGRLRTHFHMPLWWDDDGPLGSTRAEVVRTLGWLAGQPRPWPLLEVETYTWGVLGDFAGTAPLAGRLARELDFAAQALIR